MEKKELAQVVQMDAKVTFDDLVNIYVSQYEEKLHQQRASIQAKMKEVAAAKVKLIQVIRDINHDAVTDMFTKTLNDAVSATFKVKVADEGDLVKEPYWDVEVQQRIDLVAGCLQWRPRNSMYSDDVSQSVVLNLRVRVADSLVENWKTNAKESADLKEQLLLVNGDIQAIDRKTRQIKGLLATKKLDSMGATDLLELPEVQNILKLTQG